jgi:DNA polymerase III subunit delta'
MIWDKLVGQSEAIDTLRRSAAAGRLAHALLFVGPLGVGKRSAAQLLATALLCQCVREEELDACGECSSCRMMEAGMHPDFLSVACPEGKSELPIELLVGSRENRGNEGLCHDLSLRPMVGRRRVAVIDDADRMSNESANALLKTLEEPPAYAVIVLIAGDASKILPTIRSRCQTVRFRPLSAAQVARLINELEWSEDPQEALAAAELSEGSLAAAQQLLNPQLRALRDALLTGLGRPPFQSFTTAQAVLSALDSLGGDTQQQRTNAQAVVRFVIDFFRATLRAWCASTSESGEMLHGERADQSAHAESARFLARFQSDQEAAETIGAAIDRCVLTEEQLAGNVAIPLCLEALFSELATIIDSATATGSASGRG